MSGHPPNPDPNAIRVAAEIDPAGDELHSIRVGRTAMACRFEIVFNAGQHAMATMHAVEALDLVEGIESRLTVYRDDSEVARLNRAAATAPYPVADDLFELLVRCRELHAATGGAFDVAVGSLLRTWGFHQRAGRVPDPQALASAMRSSGMRHVVIDERGRSVQFDRDGVEINLGAIGKGWAVDRVVERLAERLAVDPGAASPLVTEADRGEQRDRGVHLLVHGGRSSVRALGHQASLAGAAGWLVGLVHPLRPACRLATFRLHDRSLGTSGSGTQFFVDRGRRLGHVLDPRRGVPAEGVLSATVIARSAADADALATALHVLGPKGLPRLAPRGGEISAVVVMPGRSAASVRVLTANLTPETFTVADAPGIDLVESV